MIVKQVYKTNNKRQLLINLPENFRNKTQILVVLDDSINSESNKLELMKIASKDPLFKTDIDEVSRDFKHSDDEA